MQGKGGEGEDEMAFAYETRRGAGRLGPSFANFFFVRVLRRG